MVLLIKQKASPEELKKLAGHFKGYIKVVVDIEQEILAGGADRHVDEEQALLEDGSRQKNLWGGGLDLETKEIDYNSIINLRPGQDNPSRDILSKEIREKFDTIVRKLLV
ncbi:MAG: hypothetical protein UW73_C0019G0007 [Microgenomates group bacterium GW2011_GWB1_44_8]|nr:MAG: hypothetical protein UW73_C0019G0007 [Microgenomates group bacterium GW2011_GWB1_44_8]